MKLTFENKVEIYKERKNGSSLSKFHYRWKMAVGHIQYLVRLVDMDLISNIARIINTLFNLRKKLSG